MSGPRLAVFGYGSLVSAPSASRTLGRPVEPIPARLEGWRRGWTQGRDNTRVEKRFRRPDGRTLGWILGLDLRPDPTAAAPNGALIELTEAELERLDLRELRYERVDVTESVVVETESPHPAATAGLRVVAFTAKPRHHFASPPPRAVIIAAYLRAVETAFEALAPGGAERFRETTGAPPVEVAEAVLAEDEIPEGNPREW